MNHELVRDVLKGLGGRTRHIPSKYFYDDEGSRIFEDITHLEEYYLTGAEREILRQRAPEIGRLTLDEVNLIELGAGDGSKTVDLLEGIMPLKRALAYHAFDISAGALSRLFHRINARWPRLEAHCRVTDFERGLDHLPRDGRQNVVLFLGSSIGNMLPGEAAAFLKGLSRRLNPGDLWLVGFDLVKDPRVMERAYNDGSGLTRAFNLNLLRRLNREAEADFDLDGFEHVERWDPRRKSMVSHLRSKRRQSVMVGGQKFHFRAGDLIRTEFSHKFDQARIQSLAEEAGLSLGRQWYDRRGWYSLAALEVPFTRH